MKYWLAILFCALTGTLFAQTSAEESGVHFRAVDIYVDSGNTPLAAYQIDFSVTNVMAKIVGIEGGQHPAFREAPYYDPKAMRQERVVVAAFSTERPENLPSGKTRVATIHLQTTGNARLEVRLKLQTVADLAGDKIPATATWVEKQAQ